MSREKLPYCARWVCLLALIGSACSGRPGNELSAGPTANQVAASSLADEPAQPDTCPVAETKYVRHELDAVHSVDIVNAESNVVEAAGKRWLVAKPTQFAGTVLVHLRADGQLATVSMPDWSGVMTAESDRSLRLLQTTPEPRWWSVDISRPDAPEVHAPRPVVDLVAGEKPFWFASNGTQALISMYRRDPDSRGAIGETALYDVSSGRRMGGVHDLIVWDGHCITGACLAMVSNFKTKSDYSLVRIEASGVTTIRPLTGGGGCGDWKSIRRGTRWYVAWDEGRDIWLATFDLDAGTHNETVLKARLGYQCQPFKLAPIGAGAGLMTYDSESGKPTLTRIRLNRGSPQLEPPVSILRNLAMSGDSVATGGGMLKLNATGHSETSATLGPGGPANPDLFGMTSSLPGSVLRLRRQAGSGSFTSSSTDLPDLVVPGMIEFQAHLLARPGHVGALVLGQDGEGGDRVGWFALLEAPCTTQ